MGTVAEGCFFSGAALQKREARGNIGEDFIRLRQRRSAAFFWR